MAAHGTPTFSPDDLRLLDQEEAKLVEAARRDDLDQMGQSELNDTLQRLRDRRDRSREVANRQRREARGKADPSGVTPATQSAGTEGKARVLGLALDLVTQERQRRTGVDTAQGDTGRIDAASDTVTGSGPTQRDLSDHAMALKQAGTETNAMQEDGSALHPQDPDADPGKGALADKGRKMAPSGALDHAGELPSRERSRTRY